MILYQLLGRMFSTRPAPSAPQRIVLVLPCCIGDVVMATAALKALRRRYPQAHITWAVGGWSRRAVEQHDLLDAVLDTGHAANPPATLSGMVRFVRQMRAGNFDLAVSLVRSPLMSVALMLSGIPHRAGLDSAGRGFGYTVRAPIDPTVSRPEAEIYLDVIHALGGETSDCYTNLPVTEADLQSVRGLLASRGVTGAFFVVNPNGGSNPGMMMDAKRWLPANFAALIPQIAAYLDAVPVMLGGPADADILRMVNHHLPEGSPVPVQFVGELSFGQIGALAKLSRLYVGNDTGLTHLAAATGAKTVMIMGPSDPARYAPYARDATAIWKPTTLKTGGVASGTPDDWNWSRDGVSVDEVMARIREWGQKPIVSGL